MKSRKNPVNTLGEKGEENVKLSGLDDLPYDFSKTDKIHRVSDLLRFLGIEEKRADDGGLTVRLFDGNFYHLNFESSEQFHLQTLCRFENPRMIQRRSAATLKCERSI